MKPLEKHNLDLELELRYKLTEEEFGSMLNSIKFDNEYDNSYRSYEIYLYDSIFREYNNDNKDVKCLLFRKEETIWNYTYYACLSAEKKIDDKKGDLISRGEVKMRRYVKEIKGWDGIIFLSRVPNIRYNVEIEFDDPDSIVMARRALLSLGIWSWDPEISEINVINEDDCGIDAVFDASLMDDGSYVVMDMASESYSWKERRLLSIEAIRTWRMSAEVNVIHRTNLPRSPTEDYSWIYVSPKCYSYTSFEDSQVSR
ncbi:hypothetical protein IW138_005779 [Coemansia sp. RSA 986]|nr:hypothetical protein IW138_005779 [Coemansia sp. RSA 986]